MTFKAAIMIVLTASVAYGQIQSLAHTKDGRIWLARGADLLVYQDGKAVSIEAKGIQGTIREIVADQNHLVIATDEGVFLCAESSCKPDPRVQAGTKLESIAVDAKG